MIWSNSASPARHTHLVKVHLPPCLDELVALTGNEGLPRFSTTSRAEHVLGNRPYDAFNFT